MTRDEPRDLPTVDELRVARLRGEEIVVDGPTRLRLEPGADRAAEEARASACR